MISINGLCVTYEDVPAIKDIMLEVQSGECVMITGPSGCGKTTLALAITGLIPHAIPANVQGRVVVGGMDLSMHSLSEVTQHVGMVFQNPASSLFQLRVDDEVAFGLRNLGLPEDEIKDRTAWALDAVGLEGLEGHAPAKLSGGQKQRLAIAAAVAMQPDVLVLDEPMASLDIPGIHQVMGVLQRLREDLGLTLILVEHRLVEAAQMSDRVVVMDEGCVVVEGEPEDTLGDRNLMRRLGLRRPTGEPVTPWRERVLPVDLPPDDRQPILRMSALSAGYDGNQVLHHVNLELFQGEFVALVGDNGAGKSTLALVAAGLLKPSSGVLQSELFQHSHGGQEIALVFQDPTDQLFTDTVDEEVAFCPRNYRAYDEVRHLEVLEQTDLSDLRWRRPTSLSAGQQQRTALAATLSLHPRLIILDEPTLGQDWGHLTRLMDFVSELNKKGTTILLITQDYPLVHRYARRVILLEEGRITLDGQLMGNRPEEKEGSI